MTQLAEGNAGSVPALLGRSPSQINDLLIALVGPGSLVDAPSGSQGTDPGATGSEIASLKLAARDRFRDVGFPTRRDEEWRFTNVAPIAETPLKFHSEAPSVSREEIKHHSLAGTGAIELVFVNGWFSAALSARPAVDGLEIAPLHDWIAQSGPVRHLAQYAQIKHNPFVALNTAALQDGSVATLHKGIVLDRPIHLLHIGTGGAEPAVFHPRHLLVFGEKSQATVVETYVTLDATATYFTNAVVEIVCEQGAVVDHYKVQQESTHAFHIANTQIQMALAANFTSHAINFGGAIARNDVNAVLADEGIECTLNGLYSARGRQLIDNHTSIDHTMPHCNSREIYKGILDGAGHGVFNGKIIVRQDAQKTDAKQTNQTLLLSDNAQINTKPQLEIFADDVKCTHGATVGRLSAEALFYLRTRGIGEAEARNLLIYAFASDIVSRIKVDAVRAKLDHLLLTERAIEGIIP